VRTPELEKFEDDDEPAPTCEQKEKKAPGRPKEQASSVKMQATSDLPTEPLTNRSVLLSSGRRHLPSMIKKRKERAREIVANCNELVKVL
jgi:hypothetical protein